MANIIPFKAVRPPREKAALVASKPHAEYPEEELKFVLEHNPYSFLHIVNPGYKFKKSLSGEDRFELVKNRYLEFKEEGTLQQDKNPGYYIYKTVSRNQTYCGIIAAASVEDYNQNVIKKHEDTIEKREQHFKEYLKIVGFNTEPVLLTYPDSPVLDAIFSKIMAHRPEYEFSTNNKDTHYLWLVKEPEHLEKIRQEFAAMPALYIADGHHRSISSSLLAKECKDNNPNHTGKEPYNFFLSYLIAESNLKMYEFSRIVKDLNGMDKKEFLIRLDAWFRIENRGANLYRPTKKHHFSMYLEGEYYSLYLRKTKYKGGDALGNLDPYILYKTVLQPILGIKDLRDDARISYLPGKNEPFEVKNAVDHGNFAVGFGMVPLGISEFKKISDADLVMPPKSTYIEPKLRSGLTVYEF